MPKRPRNDEEYLASKKIKHGSLETTTVLKHADQLIGCLQALKTGNDRLSDLKRLCKTLLPTFTQLAADDKAEPSEDGEIPDDADSSAPADGIKAPTFVMLTPWSPSQIATSMPPLPSIHDPTFKRAAFTHQGVCHAGDISYEKLEWIGDAYLYMLASSFIYQTFPSHSPGRSSQLRELLVKNATLAGYAKHYGLSDRANLPHEIRSTNNKDRSKIMGDMIEAYTGAVVLSDKSNGLERAATWLKSIWGMTLKQDLQKEFKQHGNSASATPASLAGPAVSSSLTPKEELANLIRVPGVTLRYEDIPCKRKDSKTSMPLFSVGVVVDGWGTKDNKLGWGTALSKKEAGQKAAAMAIANKKAIKQWIEWKQKYVAMTPPGQKPTSEEAE
ncbi:RNase3 domain-containing protein [Zalerion maritima]|uniref:RNase3 domain-containing protein n=1 Tax=Zalerion maritima TaxID=339359 RepID=A0AAD5RR77_9PEZI|nr:RNase3 domain-containing protein [Zalerion maritima]